MSKKREKLFEYAVIKQPDSEEEGEKNQESKNKEQKPEIVVKPDVILASDEKSAFLKVAQKIPSEYQENFDDLEVVVKEF